MDVDNTKRHKDHMDNILTASVATQHPDTNEYP